ncbi:hypothetical protein DM01DRAFT_1268375, partial [Hesseltinella vesiculosa]
QRQRFITAYQDHTLQYHSKHDQDDFSRAFSALVKCPWTSIFDALLDLEQSYTTAMRQLMADHQETIQSLQNKHAQMDHQNMNHFTNHVEELELAQATYASDVLQLQQSQRQEYCDFVMELYREYLLRTSSLTDQSSSTTDPIKTMAAKDLITTAAARVWKKEPTSAASSLSSSSSKVERRSSTSLDKLVQDIQEMGFTKDQAEAALALTKHNLEQAILVLVEQPKQVEDQMRKIKRRSLSMTALPPDLSPSQPSRRRSLQKPYTPPPLSSKQKGWSPISFLHQQKQALENTNLSSVRKLGGWLGKAMENLGMDNDHTDLSMATSPLVESFTITLGTAQIKSTLNLRLMVADVTSDVLDPPLDETREMGYKAQNALRLYTRQLSALIVLVEKAELTSKGSMDWLPYKTGHGSNPSLFERCMRSTDLHFPNIDIQLDTIAQDLQAHPHLFDQGSFFITKHSQLPMHQIVFHLLIDGDRRHPLMAGLRHILKVCSRYDIHSISVPLLMLPDRYLDQPDMWMPATVDQPQQHGLWLARRSENVMKTVKGCLMEASRGRGDTKMDGFGLQNVEFFIPVQQQVYMADPPAPPPLLNASGSATYPSTHALPAASTSSSSLTIPTIKSPTPHVEQIFQQLRAQLVQLFRTS